ncbi:unnamed protein product [Closterium sp. NIES-64]|nr:unnamed protein product [Closterium sp. NIES-64]
MLQQAGGPEVPRDGRSADMAIWKAAASLLSLRSAGGGPSFPHALRGGVVATRHSSAYHLTTTGDTSEAGRSNVTNGSSNDRIPSVFGLGVSQASSFRTYFTNHPSIQPYRAKSNMITQEFREKEREQAALAKQYGVAADVGSDSTAGREAQAPDKAGADADDSPAAGDSGSTGHTASSHQSSAARRLGLDLPQSGVGPTQENVARAKEVREIAKHPPDAGAAGEGASPGAGLGPGIVDVAHGTKEDL